MTTGLIARWCASERRLLAVAILFSLAASGVLLRGSASAFNSSLAPPAAKLLAPEFVAVPLNIPGTELSGGHVNTNALGGTAVMVLPLCLALAVAAVMKRRNILTFVAGSSASLIAAAVVLMTVSRSALGAAALTIVTLGLRWRGGRRWLLVALLLAGTGLAYGTITWRNAAPGEFDRRLSDSIVVRLAILQDGLDRFKESPWLGIGISQFRSGPRTSLTGDDQVAHVHNIFLQVALDVGLLGLTGYVLTFALVLLMAHRAAAHANVAGRIAAGAGLSLVAVHIFGLADAIALGAKVGVFQWWCAGLVLAAFHLSTEQRQDV
jgi:putative inorganic carbon (HCO3(-)) transporter